MFNTHLVVAESPKAKFDAKPNVLLIIVDDLGCQDLRSFNQSCLYATPAIDGLAKNGVRLTQFYSAHPVCSPTRAAIMTGKAPQRVGITQWIPQPSQVHLPLNEFTIAEAFAEAGFETGYIGKWHLGERDNQQPTGHGFNWMRAVNRAGHPGSYFFPFKRKANKNRNSDARNYWNVPDLADADKDSYLTDELTDLAIEFVTQDRQQPFFLCLSHYAVHTPIESPPSLVEKYKTRFSKKFGTPTPVIEERGAKTRGRSDHAGYAAMIENLDSNIGRLLDSLKKNKQHENTIVVLTSDNGGLSTLKNRIGPASCLPFRAGKGWVYEGGIRVPTIVSWPEKLKANEVTAPAIGMDLYPTLLELSGLKQRPKHHLDGQSLAGPLRGEKSKPTRTIGWHYPHRHGSGHRPASAIREGDFKLIHHRETNEYELYDLSKDVSERDNLIESKPAKVKHLKQKLNSWLKETCSPSS